MNVVQVLAYMRFFADWPVILMLVYQKMNHAITLKPISDPIFDYGKTKFGILEETLSDERIMKLGVEDVSLAKTLGVFLFVIVLIGISFGVYFLAKLLAKTNNPKVQGLIEKLKSVLFYNSIFRFMIQSNLKLTYTFCAFALFYSSFDSWI